MARWSDALDAQTALIRAADTREYRGYIENWIASVEEGLSVDPNLSLEAQEFSKRGDVARECAAVAADLLGRAEPVYVAAEVTELVTVAASTMQPERLLESDYFTSAGFAYFEQPISTSGAAIKALQWQVGSGGVAIVGYIEGGRVGGSDLRLGFSCVLFIDKTLDTFGTEWQTLQAFWRLAQQQIVVASNEVPDRASRRRARPRKIETVVVFKLRRVSYASDGERDVDWTHRWLVRGHWRNQWFPSLGTHRQIWIAPHVKGPDDKPFIAKTRVFEFVR